VLFERLDWRPYGIRPVLPIAATQPAGEATRVDAFRGGVAAELRARLAKAGFDGELAEAFERWAANWNLEERVDGVKEIDPVVLADLREMTS
jgi:hypothetical protein